MNKAILIAVAAFLALPVSARGSSLMPHGFCESLPLVTDPAVLAEIQAAEPRFAADLRDMTPEAAVRILDEAGARRYSAMDFMGDPGFLSGCLYYLGPETLAAVDRTFVMDLATPLSGSSTGSGPFRMRFMLVGQSRLAMVYERDAIRYYNARADRMMGVGRTVHFTIRRDSDRGIVSLADIRNLQVDTGFPFGWEDIEVVRQRAGHVETYVLHTWHEGARSSPIVRRGAARDPAHPSVLSSGAAWAWIQRLSEAGLAVFPR